MGQNFDVIEDMKWEEDRAENRLLVYGVGTQVTLRICNRLFKVSLITEIELNSFLIIFFHSIRPCPMWYRSTQDLFGSLILHVMISRTPLNREFSTEETSFSVTGIWLCPGVCLLSVRCEKVRNLAQPWALNPIPRGYVTPPVSANAGMESLQHLLSFSFPWVAASYFLMENKDVIGYGGTHL